MNGNASYTGMPSGKWTIPPTPQLIKDASMLIVGYKADPKVLKANLPSGLEPHPNGLVQMNMYQVEESQTSGFGPIGLTYLTIEVDGHDSLAQNGSLNIPGRYFAHYWNSSNRMRMYAREFSGIPALPGTYSRKNEDGILNSTLLVDDQPMIEVSAKVGKDNIGMLSGHLNYYAHRQFPLPQGGGAALSELLEFPLPFIAELYDASVDSIKFSFDKSDPASQFKPIEPLAVESVLYGKVTFTYSMGRRVIDYLESNESINN